MMDRSYNFIVRLNFVVAKWSSSYSRECHFVSRLGQWCVPHTGRLICDHYVPLLLYLVSQTITSPSRPPDTKMADQKKSVNTDKNEPLHLTGFILVSIN